NVLVKEMRALGLNVELVNTETTAATEEPPKEPAVERPRLPPAAAEEPPASPSPCLRRGRAANLPQGVAMNNAIEGTRWPRALPGERADERDYQPLQAAGAGPGLRPDPHLDREPGRHRLMVVRRDQEAGDNQLPDLQARARRSFLR